ncbi:MAG: DNA translocase FtsK 4TM domain-containing protein [Rhabdochlamydiaceae bacterium]|jgi:S-DNA-T family DNA segregation ATPase FtsK/SpoIIIE
MAKKEKIVSSSHPEARGVAFILGTFVTLLCLFSYDLTDQSTNWLGLIGHGYAWTLLYLFGLTVYPLLAFIGWIGWSYLIKGEVPSLGSKSFYMALFTLSLGMLFNLSAELGMPMPGALKHKILSEIVSFQFPYPHDSLRHYLGGVPLYYLYHDLPRYNMERLLGNLGVGITFTMTAFISFMFLTNVKIVDLIQRLFQEKEEQAPLFTNAEQIEKSLSKPAPAAPPPKQESPEIRIRTLLEREEKKSARPAKSSSGGFELPPPSLLTNPKKVDQPLLKKELKRQAEILEETLLSFGIEAKVGDINCGPTITSFEIHPAVGVKVQKITALENDIALKLQAKSIRIIAPIPGKAAVGVEVPSPYPQEVSFKEMLISYQQGSRKLLVPVILGKTVSGENMVSDLAKMPHCLIAGATGSGKSVCINTLIMSILMNATPDEIKLIMIDPKKVELTPYTQLPHLIAPVITEPHGAYAALNWMVKEMQSRYDILKHLGLRNITAFNARTPNPELESSLSVSVPERMPAIVGIIDEFADLMMASSSDLETPIARIAQMARAVGIHLVLATQRPSREVITGLIKANFPTRIAFKVASRVNSQIILDENGAESLLGNGDMLFLPPGTSHLLRAQGAYVSDEDINRVVRFICDQASPNYLISSFDSMAQQLTDGEEDDGPRDSLYDQAKAIVIETQSASTTYLQRKLKIGYARAASLMDELEMHGVISSQEGSKPRRVLIENNDESNRT